MRYERVLPVCPRVSLDASGTDTSDSESSSKPPHPDAKTAQMVIKKQLEHGMHLT